MKYGSFCALKLMAVGTLLYYLWLDFSSWLPPPRPFLTFVSQARLGRDLSWTFAALRYGLFCLAVVYLIIWDQRYRCRVCLRRLRMPVEKGSWSHMLLFGPPRTEYICTYGHGTLKVPEAHISGAEKTDWKSHEDIWTELNSIDELRGEPGGQTSKRPG